MTGSVTEKRVPRLVSAERRARASKADLAAAARILGPDDEETFQQHIKDLIAEGERLGRHVVVDLKPMTQWDPQAGLRAGLVSIAEAMRRQAEVNVGGMVMVGTPGDDGRLLWEERRVARTP